MGSFSIWHWVIIAAMVLPLLLMVAIMRPTKGEKANTWKFRTVVHLVLAFLTSFLVITIPLFVYLAYRSYKAGDLEIRMVGDSMVPADRTQQIEKLHSLLRAGALTQEEFDAEKRRVLAP